jgi:ketosteroid isomerase-like protein
VNDIDKEIAAILDAYARAVLAKDVAALMRLYDPNVRVFDTWGVWSYEGAEAWQRTVEGWLTSLAAERVKVSFAEVRSTAANDLAVVSAVVTYASLSPQGEHVGDMQNRITWGMRRTGHVLRIVHEHTSVPIGFEDSKAILQRGPGGR